MNITIVPDGVAEAMHREILLTRLNSAWNKNPHKLALLAPANAHNIAWTYQDLSKQVTSPHTCTACGSILKVMKMPRSVEGRMDC